jgi:hypothetical protein
MRPDRTTNPPPNVIVKKGGDWKPFNAKHWKKVGLSHSLQVHGPLGCTWVGAVPRLVPEMNVRPSLLAFALPGIVAALIVMLAHPASAGTPPNLLSPADGATTASNSVTLSWQDTSAGDWWNIRYGLGATDTGNNVEWGTPNLSATLDNLAFDTTYHWSIGQTFTDCTCTMYSGVRSFTTPPATPTITTTSLPTGMIGQAYSTSLAATGGTNPYSWSVASGSLPNGLSLNTNSGAITGTPTSSGASTFTAQVQDTAGHTATKNLQITTYVQPTCSANPPSFLAGASTTFTGAGGDGAYSWSAPGGNPGTGSGTTFTTSFPISGMQTMTVTSAGHSGTCGVTVYPSNSPHLDAACGANARDIVLHWTLVEGANIYYIKRGYASGAEVEVAGGVIDQVFSTYTDHVTAGSPVFYQILAAHYAPTYPGPHEYYEYPISNEVRVDVCREPGPPSDLVATAGFHEVRLSWTAPFNGNSAITGYNIYRGPDANSLSLYSPNLAPSTTFTDSSVTAGTTYYYTVRAISFYGLGDAPTTVSTTPYRVPDAPGSFDAQAGPTRNAITLTWQTPYDGASPIIRYRIWRDAHDGNGWTAVADPYPADTSWVDDACTPTCSVADGDTYDYAIAAYNVGGWGSEAHDFAQGWAKVDDGMSIDTAPCNPACPTSVLGYTRGIAPTGLPTAPQEFSIQWGNFNHHAEVKYSPSGNPYQDFWMKFDFTLGNAFPYDSNLVGTTAVVAKVQRLVPAGTTCPVPVAPNGQCWVDLTNGALGGSLSYQSGSLHSTWAIPFPDRIHVSAAELGLSSPSAATRFRIVPQVGPWTSGDKWQVTLVAAQAQLVAPPVMEVHGWSGAVSDTHTEAGMKKGDAGPYVDRADWGVLEPRPSGAQYGNPGIPQTFPGHLPYDYPACLALLLNFQSCPTRVPGQWGLFDSQVRTAAKSDLGQDPWDWAEQNPFRNFWYDGKQDIRESSVELKTMFSREWKNMTDGTSAIMFDGPKVIVAHSMGGLVARNMVEIDALSGGAKSQNLVSDIITIDTPHLGSALANDYIYATDHGWSLSNQHSYYKDADGHALWTTCQTLSPSCSDGYQDWALQPRGSRPECPRFGAYRTTADGLGAGWGHGQAFCANFEPAGLDVASDFELQPFFHVNGDPAPNPVLEKLGKTLGKDSHVRYQFLTGKLWWTDGDSVVSLSSATFNYGKGIALDSQSMYGDGSHHYCYAIYTAKHADLSWETIQTFHAAMPGIPFTARRALAFMSQTGEQPPGACVDQDPPVWGDEMSTPLDSAKTWTGTSGIAHYSWSLSGAANATTLITTDSGVLANSTLKVTSPSGLVATYPTNASWAHWLPLGKDSGQELTVLRLSAPENGAWKLDLNVTAPTPPNLMVAVRFTANVTTRNLSPTMSALGNETLFRVQVLKAGNPQAANVTVRFRNAVGQNVTLTLRDDGTHGDAIAGDGIYSGHYLFITTGIHNYQVHVVGSGVDRRLTGGMLTYVSPIEYESYCPGAIQFVASPVAVGALPPPVPPIAFPAIISAVDATACASASDAHVCVKTTSDLAPLNSTACQAISVPMNLVPLPLCTSFPPPNWVIGGPANGGANACAAPDGANLCMNAMAPQGVPGTNAASVTICGSISPAGGLVVCTAAIAGTIVTADTSCGYTQSATMCVGAAASPPVVGTQSASACNQANGASSTVCNLPPLPAGPPPPTSASCSQTSIAASALCSYVTANAGGAGAQWVTACGQYWAVPPCVSAQAVVGPFGPVPPVGPVCVP